MPYSKNKASWAEGEQVKALHMQHLEAGVFANATGVINVKEEPYNAKGDGVTDDTAAIQAAVTAAGPPGEVGAVYIPPGTYKVSSVIKVPAVAHIYGASQWTTVIKTTSKTAYIFRMEEAEIEIDHLWFQAENIQTAGGAIDGRNFISYGNIHDCTFGSNFFIGCDFSTALGGGAVFMNRLVWSEAGTGVKSTGTAIKISDNTHLAVSYWLSQIYISGATTADVKVAIDIDYADSITITDCLILKCETGIRTGNLGTKLITGVKIVDTVVDTANVIAYALVNYRDMTLINCNAQTSGKGIELAGKVVTVKGGTVQNCVERGIWITAGSTLTTLDGIHVFDNNTGNIAAMAGIIIEKGTSGVVIANCFSGNGVLETPGKQKTGILLEKGKSKSIQLLGNRTPVVGEQAAGIKNENEEALGEATGNVEANNIKV